MSPYLAPDVVQLYDAGPPDELGWPEPGAGALVWEGRGSLQLGPVLVGRNAASEGGSGPADPRAPAEGSLYLPADAPARNGLVARARGSRFALGAVRLVPDPVSLGAGCVVASVVELGDDPT